MFAGPLVAKAKERRYIPTADQCDLGSKSTSPPHSDSRGLACFLLRQHLFKPS